VSYPTRYRDARGEIATTLRNDGRALRLPLDGVEFEGCDFDALEPDHGADPTLLSRFTLDDLSCLCDCSLEFEMPLTLVRAESKVVGALQVNLVLGRPAGVGTDGQTLEGTFIDLTTITGLTG
jgi:hypothetical protein